MAGLNIASMLCPRQPDQERKHGIWVQVTQMECFIKVCRQRRKTFLLLYCLFFIFIIIFLFLSHYLRSAISLPFVIGSFSNLAS